MAETGQRLGDTSPVGQAPAVWRRIGDFIALTKPRPMSVVVFTALAGLVAPRLVPLDPVQGALAMLAIALGGGGSAVLNMWFERDLDRRMVRTAGRPIAAGRISPAQALAFAVMLISVGLVLMVKVAGPVAAAMLALTILFYGVVYTMWLKRLTALNVVIGGGMASLLTPLTGYAASEGSVTLEALALFAFLVPWTPPHVWSQALVRQSDYANAGVPMMPVLVGSERTRSLIVGFTLAHAILALLPFVLGAVGYVWLAAAVFGGGLLCVEALKLQRMADDAVMRRAAWQFYRLNSVYVVLLLAALIAERTIMHSIH